MSWNHRVIRKTFGDETYFQIHEVYYDDQGKPKVCTVDSVAAMGETPEILRSELIMMLAAYEKPILDYDDDFKPKSNKVLDLMAEEKLLHGGLMVGDKE